MGWPFLVAALLASCDWDGTLGPPPGLPHAAAARSCAPDDGPAVDIYLATARIEALAPAVPYVRLTIWQPLAAIRGRTWTLSTGSSEGAAQLVTQTDTFESASAGTVNITAVLPDTTVEGTVSLRFARAGRVRGTFRGTWISRSALCG